MAVLKSFAIVAGLFIAYGVYWFYQDRRAESAANQFCNAVVIGTDVSSAIAQGQAAGARRMSGENSNPQLFFFQGPIFNGFNCELTLVDGKVASRKVAHYGD